MNESDVCIGCFRSLAEISHWQQADEQKRKLILEAAENRQREYRQKYPLSNQMRSG